MSVEIVNIGYFYRDPDSLVRFIKNCDPSAIILNWCWSENSESRLLLQRAGLLAKLYLNDERVLLTGNKTIRLDENQEALINEMEMKLKKLRDVPGSPRPHIFIHGPAGEAKTSIKRFSVHFINFFLNPGSGKTLMGIEVTKMLCADRRIDPRDVMVISAYPGT